MHINHLPKPHATLAMTKISLCIFSRHPPAAAPCIQQVMMISWKEKKKKGEEETCPHCHALPRSKPEIRSMAATLSHGVRVLWKRHVASLYFRSFAFLFFSFPPIVHNGNRNHGAGDGGERERERASRPEKQKTIPVSGSASVTRGHAQIPHHHNNFPTAVKISLSLSLSLLSFFYLALAQPSSHPEKHTKCDP